MVDKKTTTTVKPQLQAYYLPDFGVTVMAEDALSAVEEAKKLKSKGNKS